MRKPLVGVILGAIVYFGWGMLSWTLLPWHNNTMKKLPEEQLIMDTLKTVVTVPGFYVFPNGTGPDGRMDEKSWTDKYKRGPIGVMAFSPAGREPMGAGNFIFSLVGAFIISGIGMMLLCVSRDRVKGFLPRALFLVLLGVAISAAVHLPYWNWFNFPSDFTAIAMLDALVSFLLLGLVQAKFVPEA